MMTAHLPKPTRGPYAKHDPTIRNCPIIPHTRTHRTPRGAGLRAQHCAPHRQAQHPVHDSRHGAGLPARHSRPPAARAVHRRFEVNIRHVATADIGVTVVANAELEKVDGRWLYFKVEVLDGERTIGVGTHRRAIITLPPDATNRGGGDDSHRHEL